MSNLSRKDQEYSKLKAIGKVYRYIHDAYRFERDFPSAEHSQITLDLLDAALDTIDQASDEQYKIWAALDENDALNPPTPPTS